MILVTGGTGLVGAHLLYFLIQENEQIRAIHRGNSNLEDVKKVFSYYTEDFENLFNQIEWMEADILDIPALSKAFEGITHVYHAAAYISFDPDHYRKLKKTNVEGTANIVNLCLANNVDKLCYVSSIATLGATNNGEFITEETEWNPETDNSVYAITKYGAEMEVWRGSQEGLKVVIVNPSIIFGQFPQVVGSGTIIKLVDKKFPFYTNGGFGIVDVKDVVKTMVLLMKSSKENQRFILNSKNLTYQELLSKIAFYLRVKPPSRPISQWKLNFFATMDWLFSKIFGSKRKLLKATVNSMYRISYFDASKIENELEVAFLPYEKTLQNSVENYLMESNR